MDSNPYESPRAVGRETIASLSPTQRVVKLALLAVAAMTGIATVIATSIAAISVGIGLLYWDTEVLFFSIFWVLGSAVMIVGTRSLIQSARRIGRDS